eukprot:TRINITY_DN11845_c0_g1_i3.p1 TRINITY_DN11845_c0_g1~~TRINITY_DN11845_c0_g1_i3.p1  ORF type:complete len:279 (-),score=40.59 TRINITY_DN11845_c0_g1_i3:121-957(-)
MIRRPPRSTQSRSSAASDVYKRQVLWSADTATEDIDPKNDCIADGRYCAQDPDGEGPLHGTTILNEILRNICFAKKYKRRWFEYATRFGQTCIDKMPLFSDESLNKCRNGIYKDMKVDHTEIDGCVESSTESNGDNKVLREEMQKFKESGLYYYPALTINGFSQRLLSGEAIAVEVCNHLLKGDENDYCKDIRQNVDRSYLTVNQTIIYEEEKSQTSTEIARTIGLLLLMLACFLLMFWLVYTRLLAQQLKSTTEEHVNQAVSLYLKFQETRPRATKA